MFLTTFLNHYCLLSFILQLLDSGGTGGLNSMNFRLSIKNLVSILLRLNCNSH